MARAWPERRHGAEAAAEAGAPFGLGLGFLGSEARGRVREGEGQASWGGLLVLPWGAMARGGVVIDTAAAAAWRQWSHCRHRADVNFAKTPPAV